VTYAGQIKDILDRKCVPCHKPSKAKADLLMDSLENVMKGGEIGAVIEPGDPAKSEMYRRITLDPDDEDFMPSDGKPPLTEAEVRLIERWIASGAK
jgi:hypothetical protein